VIIDILATTIIVSDQ